MLLYSVQHWSISLCTNMSLECIRLAAASGVRGRVGGSRVATSRKLKAITSQQHLTMVVNSSDSSRVKLLSGGLVLPAEVSHVDAAATALRKSQVIAVPTDTLYGFACDACSEPAIQSIYNIKGRSATRPLAICVADVDDIQHYGTVNHLPEGLLVSLFPGPVTLILPREDSSQLTPALNPGLPSVGVRIPDDIFIRSLCRAFGGAMALTSANLSSQPSTVAVEEFRDLWRHCAFVFDAGQLPAGRAGSTIVDLTLTGTFKVLRDGSSLRETTHMLTVFGLSERAEEKLPELDNFSAAR